MATVLYRKSRRSIQPEARVFILTNKGGGTYQLLGKESGLDSFTGIDVSNVMSGVSSASISYQNTEDKFFVGIQRSKAESRKRDAIAVIRDLILDPKLVKEISKLRRTNKRNPLSYIQEDFLLEFQLMDRIWIDFRGQDGKWYAGFTGLISQIVDSYTVGGTPVIKIQCKDMRRILQVSMLITSRAVDVVDSTVQDSYLYHLDPLTNLYSAAVDGADILGSVVNTANSFFIGKDSSFYFRTPFWVVPEQVKLEMKESVNASVLRMSSLPGSAFSNLNRSLSESIITPLLLTQIAKSLPKDFVGSSHERSIEGFAKSPELTINALGQSVEKLQLMIKKRSSSSIGKSYSQVGIPVPSRVVDRVVNMSKGPNGELLGPSTGMSLKDFSPPMDPVYEMGNLEIDKEIALDETFIAYQKIIQGVFSLYQTGRRSAEDILKQVAEATIFDLYQDTMGHLIYQKLKYDRFPGRDEDPDSLEGRDAGLLFLDKDEIVRMRDDGFQLFHGSNYIIGDDSLLGWDITEKEDDIRTFVTVKGAVNLSPGFAGPDAQYKFFTGFASADNNLFRRFGYRAFNDGQKISDSIPDKASLDSLAKAVLRQMNSKSRIATIKLSARPDLQMGRTVYLSEREYLGYVQAIHHTYVEGESFDTTLSCNYVHHPSIPIGDPWSKSTTAMSKNISVSALQDTEKKGTQKTKSEGQGANKLNPNSSTKTAITTLQVLEAKVSGMQDNLDKVKKFKLSDEARKSAEEHLEKAQRELSGFKKNQPKKKKSS